MTLRTNIDEWFTEEEAREVLLRSLLQQELEIVTQETLALTILGVNQGVYDTPEGRYERTRTLFRNIDVQNLSRGNRYQIQVSNTTSYAQKVEYGDFGVSSEGQYQAEAESLGAAEKTLYKGRSARKWRRPNPAHLRAAVWAGLKLNNMLDTYIREAWGV